MIVNDNINYLLIDIEPMSIFESIDVRSVTSKPEFPSEEFGDFMELLAKWNLSDACGSDILKFSKKICRDDVNLPTSVKQGRQLLDQIVVPHISFKKSPIMTYKEETYYLHYRPIFDAIKELLSNKDIFTRPLLDYRNDGFDLKTNNGQLWCFPFISVMLGDLPENAAVTLTYNSVNCKYPCHKCLIENDELNNTRLNGDEIVLRTPENMKDYVNRGIANQYSLHNMKNIFWKHP